MRWFGGWFVGAWGRIIVVEQIRGVWLWVVVGWTMSRRVGFADRACTRRETQGEDWAFALCARGGGVRFLCSFRLDPLTLGGSSLICSGLTDKQCRRRLRGTCGSDRCDADLCQ